MHDQITHWRQSTAAGAFWGPTFCWPAVFLTFTTHAAYLVGTPDPLTEQDQGSEIHTTLVADPSLAGRVGDT